MGIMGKRRWEILPGTMASAAVRTADRRVGWRGSPALGNVIAKSVHGVLIAAVSGGLLWIVWIYGNGLRDPRYLDGWVLAGGMILQLSFHVATKTASLNPKSAIRWRKLHIFAGYMLVTAFVSHSDFSLPDTRFELALYVCFVLVTLSGISGTYLAWSRHAKRGIDERVSYNGISARRAELAREVYAAVTWVDPAAAAIALPVQPHDAWILDLYTNHLRDFFDGPRNTIAHLTGSQRPLKRLTGEIDGLSRYVDAAGQDKLAAINALLAEKDRLDYTGVYLGLTRGWQLVHVPLTYSLIVMSVLHILVVYAFSSGDW
jgi:hypothetical protein